VGTLEVRDSVVWIKHISGSNNLVDQMNSLEAGEQIELEIDGETGIWERMRDGKDGRPTYGIKPVGPAKDMWEGLARGTWVTISSPGAAQPGPDKVGSVTNAGQSLKGFVMECGRCGFEYKFIGDEIEVAKCPNCSGK
jgi:hypothetical protein